MAIQRALSGRPGKIFSVLLVLCHPHILSAQSPTILTPLEASKSVKQLPSYVGFGYCGLAFHSSKLYASCNVGLLEIENGAVTKAYLWSKFDSAVQGPWSDSANSKLWVWRPSNDSLANFDGKAWQAVPMPQLKRGYVTRGDVLGGYRGVSGTSSFWMTGVGNAWLWDEGRKKWGTQLDLPNFLSGNRRGKLQHLFLIGDIPFAVARYQEGWEIDLGRHLGGKVIGDTCHYFDKEWRPIPDSSNGVCFAEQAVSVGGRGFVRTVDGEILTVDTTGIFKLKSPGFCEELAVTSAGTLLASFRDQGVHEFVKDWALRFKAPYQPAKGETWVHLAEDRGRIALAIHPVPDLQNGKTVYKSVAGLWFFDGNEVVKVQFPIASAKIDPHESHP